MNGDNCDNGEYKVDFDKPIHTPTRKLKVICIGAGASGLLIAYKLQRHFDDFELNVYEKNKDVSGTWYENRYPGCACDVPSHCYTWSFEPKTDWSSTYASAKEIHQYFAGFAKKYQLGRYIKLEHEVIGATWDEAAAQWHVKIRQGTTEILVEDSCHVLLNAGGILNAWKWPAIPGLENYKGTLVHSAAWPEDLDLTGKVVGLIGNGSSGVQILPAIQAEVKELTTFIREPTWIAPPLGEAYQVFTDADKASFAADPEKHLVLRRGIESGINSAFAMFTLADGRQKEIRTAFEDRMRQQLSDPRTAHFQNALIPTWSVGCRRLSPGIDYLKSLSAPNVSVVFGNITHVTSAGCVMSSGEEYPTDVLICATGFDTSLRPRFPVIGRAGVDLREKWKDEPRAYLGFAAAGFPNYLMTLGPNCPIGNGAVLAGIEAQVEYFVKLLSKFQKEMLTTFDVREEAVDDFVEHKDEFMKNTVWTEDCRSWYKGDNIHGKVTALWPGSSLHYIEAVREVRYEDWALTREKRNRFQFLGNGHSTAEKRTGEMAYYIRNSDDSWIDPVLKAKL